MIFLILGVGFGAVGLAIILQLKENFDTFYDKYKGLLIIAILALSVPIISRGIFDLFKSINILFDFNIGDEGVLGYDTDHLYDRLVIWLLCNMLPLSFQLASLVFGYIKKKNDKSIVKI